MIGLEQFFAGLDENPEIVFGPHLDLVLAGQGIISMRFEWKMVDHP